MQPPDFLPPDHDDASPNHLPLPSRLREIFIAFGKLGLISFGGPIAHFGYFHSEFVERRKWIRDSEYADLVALCQFLPGPASSQVVFALGFRRAGFLGAILASLCFMLPSAFILIAFAYGVVTAGDLSHAGWLHGLKLAAVSVVAQAVWRMGKKLCPDRIRVTLCIAAASTLLLFTNAAMQVGIIAAGGLIGYLLYRKDTLATDTLDQACEVKGHFLAASALTAFLLLLLVLPLVRASTSNLYIAYFDSFYRSGSLVFGGGHVVLPLLRQEIVPKGWLSDDLFLAGYGAAQAVPGPLFTFSAYLGAAMRPGQMGWAVGLWCLMAIFLPAWLLVGGMLPFWNTLRAKQWTQAALRGANAVVVGVLLAALYNPISIEGIRRPRDGAAAVIAFLCLEHWKIPSWMVVVMLAVAGFWLV